MFRVDPSRQCVISSWMMMKESSSRVPPWGVGLGGDDSELIVDTLSRKKQPLFFDSSLRSLIEMDDDDGDDCVRHGSFGSACGLLLPPPRFLLKNSSSGSAGLVNSVPTMDDTRIRAAAAAAPSHGNKILAVIDKADNNAVTNGGNKGELKQEMATIDDDRSFGHHPEKGGYYRTFQELLLADPDEEEEESTSTIRVVEKTMDFNRAKEEFNKTTSCVVEKTSAASRVNFEIPLPPLLLPPPSDSWLWQTLPSLSRKNATKLRSYLAAAEIHRQPQGQGCYMINKHVSPHCIVPSRDT